MSILNSLAQNTHANLVRMKRSGISIATFLITVSCLTVSSAQGQAVSQEEYMAYISAAAEDGWEPIRPLVT